MKPETDTTASILAMAQDLINARGSSWLSFLELKMIIEKVLAKQYEVCGSASDLIEHVQEGSND